MKTPIMTLKSYFQSLSTKGLVSTIAVIVVLAIFAALPFFVDVDTAYVGYYIFITCVYLTMAQSWNLIAGYAGQVSLGQNAFFGLGAYTMAALWLNGVGLWFFFDVSLLIAAGVVPAILAAIVGVPLLMRLGGHYFAFGTLGMSMIVTIVFLKGGDVTGGPDGVWLDPSFFSGMRVYYWVSLLIAILSTLTVYLVSNSKMGLALKAIREDDISAASHGIGVFKYKMIAFVIAAFMAGVAGAVYAYYIFHLEPATVFHLNWLFYPVLMVVLGGTGTILGPVIGAVIISALFSYGDVYFGGYQTIVSALLIILIMRFMPTGVLGMASRVSLLWRRDTSGAGHTGSGTESAG